MTVENQLNERHQKVLEATVKHYIATAEPVGSNTLIKEYDFSVSSATIRNTMGRLEKAGFLYQPHTSAGRIPSDSGYRVYVDKLLPTENKMSFQLQQLFDSTWVSLAGRYEVLFQKITHILAEVSGCIALITLPQLTSNILHHLHLVRVAHDKIMLVIVIDNYQTESCILDGDQLNIYSSEDDEEIINHKLQIISNFLNHKLRGKSVKEINDLNWSELDSDFQIYADFINELLVNIKSKYRFSQDAPIFLKGFSQLVQQPEFSHIEQVKILINFLEKEQQKLLPLIFQEENSLDGQKVKIRIGTENPLESMQSCSIISAYYSQDNYPVGSVGIIGPTRMPYDSAIALVESTANYISERL